MYRLRPDAVQASVPTLRPYQCPLPVRAGRGQNDSDCRADGSLPAI